MWWLPVLTGLFILKMLWWIPIFITILIVFFCIRFFRQKCWFCNTGAFVSFMSRNSWDCPACGQYNGFNKDGDYNKEMTDQYVEQTPKKCSRPGPLLSSSPLQKKISLCAVCNNFQAIKTRLLSEFEPENERNYEREIAVFKQSLEEEYALCHKCELVLKRHLSAQERHLEAKVLDSKLSWARTQTHKGSKGSPLMNRINCLLHMVTLITAFIICCCEVNIFLQMGPLGIKDVSISGFKKMVNLLYSMLLKHTDKIQIFSSVLDGLCLRRFSFNLGAVFLQAISSITEEFSVSNLVRNLFWTLLLVSFFFNNPSSGASWRLYLLARIFLLLLYVVGNIGCVWQSICAFTPRIFYFRKMKKRIKHDTSMSDLSVQECAPRKSEISEESMVESDDEEYTGLHTSLPNLTIGQGGATFQNTFSTSTSTPVFTPVPDENRTTPSGANGPLIQPARLNLHFTSRADFHRMRDASFQDEPLEMEIDVSESMNSDTDSEANEDPLVVDMDDEQDSDLAEDSVLVVESEEPRGRVYFRSCFWSLVYSSVLIFSLSLNLYFMFYWTDWTQRISKTLTESMKFPLALSNVNLTRFFK